MVYLIDIDIKNMDKIEPLKIAIQTDSLNSGLDNLYLILFVLNKHYDIRKSDLKALYKLMLHDSINKDSTIADIFINILYDYYKADIEK